jgi:endo-1,4-beta-xylanase
MIKFDRNRLISRRLAVKMGISAVTTLTVLSLGKLKVLSYLIYTLDNQRQIKHKYQRTFKVVGKASLQRRAKAKGLIYGAFPEAERQKFDRDISLQSSLIRECAMMTVGTLWTSIRPNNLTTFDFSDTDYFVKFASMHKILLRGIPLIWHEALPDWLPPILNSDNAEQILTNHIETVMRRYAGKMHSWDVVNEAIHVGDKRADGLRETPWLKFLGVDYVDLAFRVAAKADPQAKLVYNEFGVEYDQPEDEARREALLSLLQRLKSKETPIYALGLQSHLLGDLDSFNPQKFREFLKNVASLGLKIMITELDVSDDNLPMDLNQRDRIIAGAYEDYLSIALAEKAVISVTSWGLSDRYTWLARHKPRTDRAEVRPLPFDREMQPKLVWNAIARTFDRAPKR